MQKRTMVAALAVVAIVVSIGLTISTLRGPKTPLTPYQAWGLGAAQATGKFLQDQGGVVVVCPDFGKFKILNPRYDALLKSYTKTVAKQTHLRVEAVERVPVPPPTMARVGIYLSAEQYEALSSKHAKAGAIVSFIGLPSLTDVNIAAAQKTGAKWVVVSDYGADYKRLLGKQAMQLAVVPRLQDPPEFPKPSNLQEQFEREYEVLTPARSADLPD
jgi:hypothetical protein